MWESKIKTVKDCSLVKDEREIFIEPKVKIKIDLLMNLFPNTEWLAYLIGEDNNIKDIIIPEQEVTSVSVDVIEFPKDIKTIGVMHSHHGMSSNFSGIDNDYINGNHDISICISHNEISGVSRAKTPCGAFKIIPLVINFNDNIKLDIENFLAEVDENIIMDDFEEEDENDGIEFFDTDETFEDDLGIDNIDEDMEEMKRSIKRNIIKNTKLYKP